MFKITGRGVVWCPATNKPLIKFGKTGIAETADEKMADQLKKRGYHVEGDVKKK